MFKNVCIGLVTQTMGIMEAMFSETITMEEVG